MPLRKDLLNPISAGKPSGESLRYAAVYDKIKEARREDDDAPQGEWKVERKVADWPLTIKLIGDALAAQSKDVQMTAWLAEAMLHREGVAGLREVLDLIRGYLESFWDTLYPELDDGDAEFRAAPLQWLGDRLESAVKGTGLTRSGLNWFQYKESRAVGTEEAADTDEKRQARLNAIAEGKIPQEQFDKAFDETPKQFYVSHLETLDGTLESLSALGAVCDEKFGDLTPSFGTLKRALEEMRQTVYILLQVKREKEPDEPAAAVEPEGESGPAYEEPAVQATASVATGTAAAPARARTGALSAEPVDREDAIGRVVAAARFLRQQDPYSPAPFLMLRGLRWGELRAGGTEVDQMLLGAPPTEIRQKLKRLSLEANWTEVLETAETAVGMECGRGWLDVQRYAGRACYELGAYYDAIRNAIVSGLRGLLADYPKLPELTMMDDTPTANVETLAWLKENVPPAAAEPAYSPASYQPVAEEESGAPATLDTFDLALQAARSGRPQEGIQMLMREMTHERSGRGRFYRKVQLTKLCDSTGYDAIAFPILQELAAEIEHRKLEDWEAAELVAEPLALLYRSLSKSGGDAAEIQKLYSWICRLDPLQAMSISR
jgi:type VI secretion system protein ImpA